MIREKTSNKSHNNKFDTNPANVDFFTGSSQIKQDTLLVKEPTVKLNLPKSTTSIKLKEINERIQRLDPPKRKQVIIQPKISRVETDTLQINLYDADSVSYLIERNEWDNEFVENCFLNIPDYKPVIKLIDSTNVNVQAKKLETKQREYKSVLYKESANKYQQQYNADWVPGFLIIVFLLMAWIRVFYNKVLKVTVRSTFNSLISNRLFRERNTLTIWGGIILSLLFYMSGGFFIYLLFTYFGFRLDNLTGLTTFLIIVVFLIVIYLIKFIFVKTLGFIFKENSGVSEYLHNVFIYNKTIGVFILPAILIIPYIPEPGKEILIKLGSGMIILFYFLRIFRGLKIGIKINVSIFYLILYLCILEFFPLLILYKLFISFTSY